MGRLVTIGPLGQLAACRYIFQLGGARLLDCHTTFGYIPVPLFRGEKNAILEITYHIQVVYV
jgi:hypothetical protein